MSITPEMGKAIRTLQECEAKGDNTSDAYAHAMDVFIAANGYQLEPKASASSRAWPSRTRISTARRAR